jgi:ribosomal protein L34
MRTFQPNTVRREHSSYFVVSTTPYVVRSFMADRGIIQGAVVVLIAFALSGPSHIPSTRTLYFVLRMRTRRTFVKSAGEQAFLARLRTASYQVAHGRRVPYRYGVLLEESVISGDRRCSLRKQSPCTEYYARTRRPSRRLSSSRHLPPASTYQYVVRCCMD